MQKHRSSGRSHRPKALTVFAAAFVAGAVAAVGINRAVDVHLAQAKPQIECEPIFVALRTLPQGSPVTIWDVALRDWPKAMLPATALRADDHFEGMILKHPVREGQPLLSVQLVKADRPSVSGLAAQVAETYVPATIHPPAQPDADLWTPSAVPVTTAHPAPAAASDASVRPTPVPVDTPVAIAAPPVATDIAARSQPVQPSFIEATLQLPPVTVQDDSSAGNLATTPEATDTESIASVTPSADPVGEAVPSQAGAAPIKRYLVVPERIATLADTSFAAPAARQPQAASQPESTARSQPSTAQAKSASARTNSPTTPRKPATSPGPAATKKKPKSVPPVTEAPTNRTFAQPTPQPRPQGMFGSMFPGLRAGVDAASGRSGASTPPAEQQSARKPSSRTAQWPWSTNGSTSQNQRGF